MKKTLLLVPVSVCLFMAASGPGGNYLRQSRGVNDPNDLDEWRSHEDRGGLGAYTIVKPGTPNPPGELWRLGGSGATSFASPDLGQPFANFRDAMKRQRPQVDAAARKVLESRYKLECATDPKITMSRGKPQPLGPAARLPHGITSWEQLAELPAEQIRSHEWFPYPPLDHPLQSTGHMLFPAFWTKPHPEHERFDVGFDLPDCFLPEFPPPLYLTTHRELGDVSRGVEVTYGNYFNMFNGLITPEQMDGLRLLVTPFPTSWFNTTQHRVTEEPSEGVTCFSCHVNGHTNAAIELTPDTRPNYGRPRADTPTMRGNYAFLLYSSKRAIHAMDHFAEVEEYFDGDPTLLAAIGGRNLEKAQTNHMADFNAIIDFPPAPKLDPLNRLIPAVATAQELRGESLFLGKAQCAVCHPPAGQYTDNTMHDLRLERFYPGRPEGPVKTFTLRGIKDSPPYFHDGRLLTLEDAVELFNLVLGTHLSAAEKCDLVAYLRAI